MASNSLRHRHRRLVTTVDTEEQRSNPVRDRCSLLSSVSSVVESVL
jgi:hypothetical protein